MSQTSFVELLIGNGIGRNARLEKIAQLLDWSRLQTLVEQVRPGDTGRPPYPPLAMFKALLLQQWYGLSDPGLEEALSIGFRSDGFAAYRWRGQRRTRPPSAGSATI